MRASPPTLQVHLGSLLLFSAQVWSAPSPERALLWSLAPLERPPVPEVRDAAWARTPVDAFILSRLEKAGLTPSTEAPRQEILRRASLDLAGLLPEPEDLDLFLADDSPDAFEKVIDRLLASPRHGERWARHWLDLARYAESEGFKSDETRPNAWRYRDYVIKSFNQDKPYDRFVREQIAGDELWPEDPDALAATGFNRHWPDESNARDLLQRRQEILNDITDTVGVVFTGLTFGCARCHDHKHDPILTRDYYQLQSFFAGVRAVDDVALLSPEEAQRHAARRVVWEDATRPVREEMLAIEEEKRRQMADDAFPKFPPEIQSAITKPAAERSPIEWLMFYKAQPYLQPPRQWIIDQLGGKAKERWQALRREIDKHAEIDPGELPIASGIADVGREAPKTFVLARGQRDAPQEEVSPGFLTALRLPAPRIEPPAGRESTGRRTALADWLVDPTNPLTARVIVNRIWHYHFGRGLAGTPNDFGTLGEPPSHPELLDWLATELIRSGWSLKHLHRLILTSSVYRQAAAHREEAARVDPENRLLWRAARRRLEGEVIRDAALQAAGLLNLRAGGPSVFPALPRGMEAGDKWRATTDSVEQNRRSIYVFVRRNLRYPFFEAFDMPDTHESCGRRNVTVTAPQALLLLNDDLLLAWARGFAARVCESAGEDGERAQIVAAYRIAYSRSPDAAEVELALAFLARQRGLLAERAAPLADLCHVLLNSNEFVYRN